MTDSHTDLVNKKCNGIMGVPITYLDKHNPDEYELIGDLRPIVQGKEIYKRILIRRKNKNLTCLI